MSKQHTWKWLRHTVRTSDHPIATPVGPTTDGVLSELSSENQPRSFFRVPPGMVLSGVAVVLMVMGGAALIGKRGAGTGSSVSGNVQTTPDGISQSATPAILTPSSMPTPSITPSPAPTADPALDLAEQGVDDNSDWTAYIQTFDEVKMALVPVGCFRMGAVGVYRNEVPVHEICFNTPFWIDMSEVSNNQYGAPGYFEGDELPHETVSWFEAVAFCEVRGGRLPTEAEWEYAARGPDDLPYPWGARFVDGYAVYRNNSGGSTQCTDRRPDGQSWVGALDMSGNVGEWVSSLYKLYPYDAMDGREADGSTDGVNARVIRGGSWWTVYPLDLRTAVRYGSIPTNVSNYVGFRCARSYQE